MLRHVNCSIFIGRMKRGNRNEMPPFKVSKIRSLEVYFNTSLNVAGRVVIIVHRKSEL